MSIKIYVKYVKNNRDFHTTKLNLPTRGLDIGATEFVRQQLIDQRNAGKGVMLISADLEEIMALSDRIAVLFGGKIVGILNREEATVQKIGLLMGGISEEEAR